MSVYYLFKFNLILQWFYTRGMETQYNQLCFITHLLKIILTFNLIYIFDTLILVNEVSKMNFA